MPYCRECGANIGTDVSYCPECGHEVGSDGTGSAGDAGSTTGDAVSSDETITLGITESETGSDKRVYRVSNLVY